MKSDSTDKLSISVLMPALNEEKNIETAVTNTLEAFDDLDIKGEVIVINDGSTDGTKQIVSELMQMDDRVKMLEHQFAKGIGNSFWDGVDNAASDYVVMIPGDNENDPWEILRYHKLLNHVDMIIPFVFNKEVRPLHRNILSYIYRVIVNTTFLVNFNYTNGTVLFSKAVLKDLGYRSEGFFFHTDILVRAAKRGYLFAEVPYRLGMRSQGASKAVTFPSFSNVIRGYLRLVRDLYFTKKIKRKGAYVKDSQTLERYSNNAKTTRFKGA